MLEGSLVVASLHHNQDFKQNHLTVVLGDLALREGVRKEGEKRRGKEEGVGSEEGEKRRGEEGGRE